MTELAVAVDGSVHIIGGSAERVLHGNGERVLCLRFSKDGSLLASSTHGGSVVIWNPDSGDVVQRLVSIAGFVMSIVFSPDNEFIVLGTEVPDVIMSSIETGLVVKKFYGNSYHITSVDYSQDGTMIASGSYEGIVHVWNMDGVCLFFVEIDKALVTSVNFSPDGRTVLSGSNNGFARCWDLKTGEVKRTHRSRSDIISCQYSPDGERIHMCCSNSYESWNLKTKEVISIELGGQVICFDIHSNEQIIVCGYRTSYIEQINVETMESSHIDISGRVRDLCIRPECVVLM
jgi:WD40 repeat protein